MLLFPLILIAIALAMDSFAVSISTGLAMRQLRLKQMMKISLIFGFFQGLMPIIGWCAGLYFEPFIKQLDHWIAFILLGFIGGKMIWESFRNCASAPVINPYSNRTIITLAFATSIDALAIGLSFSLLNDTILIPAFIIGLVTVVFSMAGLILGVKLGNICPGRIIFLGGIILIFIGVKILVEHLGQCC